MERVYHVYRASSCLSTIYFLTATTPSRISLLRVKAGYGWICLLFKAGAAWILTLFLMYFPSLPGGL